MTKKEKLQIILDPLREKRWAARAARRLERSAYLKEWKRRNPLSPEEKQEQKRVEKLKNQKN